MPIMSMVKSGDDLVVTIQLTFDGATADIAGATCTATIRDGEHPQSKLITDHAVAIFTAATSVVTLTLTAAQAATLRTRADYRTAIGHLCDVKVVAAGGAVSHSDTFTMPVRRAIT